MNLSKPLLWGAALLVAMMSATGCQSTRSSANVDGIPRITKLCRKVSAPQVHRFRKPVRDERARVSRLLSRECDRLIADAATWESSAELTAIGADAQDSVCADIQELVASLEELRDAANTGQTRSMRAAHDAATAAYARIGAQVNLAGPR